MPSYKNIFIEGAISPQKIAEVIAGHSSKHSAGAHSIFIGQVRADETENGHITAIDYTAYREMALKKAHSIREECFQKFPLKCMHIYHSLGRVKAGEICLFVFVTSKNRKPAIEACACAVERIKKELPVWGQEISDKEKKYWKINTF